MRGAIRAIAACCHPDSMKAVAAGAAGGAMFSDALRVGEHAEALGWVEPAELSGHRAAEAVVVEVTAT